jgi:hypothetical protein
MTNQNTSRTRTAQVALVAFVGMAAAAGFALMVGGCGTNGGTGYCTQNTDCGGRNLDYSELNPGEKYCSNNQCYTKPQG